MLQARDIARQIDSSAALLLRDSEDVILVAEVSDEDVSERVDADVEEARNLVDALLSTPNVTAAVRLLREDTKLFLLGYVEGVSRYKHITEALSA